KILLIQFAHRPSDRGERWNLDAFTGAIRSTLVEFPASAPKGGDDASDDIAPNHDSRGTPATLEITAVRDTEPSPGSERRQDWVKEKIGVQWFKMKKIAFKWPDFVKKVTSEAESQNGVNMPLKVSAKDADLRLE